MFDDEFFEGAWILLFLVGTPIATVYACVALVLGRLPAPVATSAVAGWCWTLLVSWAAFDRWLSEWRGERTYAATGGSVLEMLQWALLGLVPSLMWIGVIRARRRELRALAGRGAEGAGEGRWRIRVGTTEIGVAREHTWWRRRFLDFRAHVFSVALPLPDLLPAVEAGRAWRYDGPPHLAAIWLSGNAPARLGVLLGRRTARVADGRLTVHVRGFLTEATVAAVIAELHGVVEAVRASGREAVPRFQADARAVNGHAARVDAWRTLADHLPEGLAEVAPEGVSDPDPVIRAIAARALGDSATIAAILARSEDTEAVRRAIGAVREHAWEALADRVAEQIGGPHEAVWFDAVRLLGALGGRRHVPRLLEAVNAEGYSAELGAEADIALARIRARLGGDAAGRVTLATGAGGEVALAAEGGEVSVVRESGSARK